MMRRDYILRMIEDIVRMLARIDSLKRGQKWNEASEALDGEFTRLIGQGARGVAQLSETDLLARLMQEGPTHAFHEKASILITLLKEAGDVATAENRLDDADEYYLKALHLSLEVIARGDAFEFPEFVPKIDILAGALQPTLPARTRAMLMQHYERIGEFAKAEDELFALLEGDPGNEAIGELGDAFYRRLLAQSDDALVVGNLPRAEVEEGAKELAARRKSALR